MSPRSATTETSSSASRASVPSPPRRDMRLPAKDLDDATSYTAVPPTPQASPNKPTTKKKKKNPSRAERYALEPPFRERENPLARTSLVSVLSVQWLQLLVSLGAQKVLEKHDLWRVCPADTCDALQHRFTQHYTIQQGPHRERGTPVYQKALRLSCGDVWVAVSYIPMLFIFVITGLYFKRTSREIKRLEGITRTPVFDLFSETLNGLHTIRAFKMRDEFKRINRIVVDDNASYCFNYWAAGRWLAVRLDWLSVLISFVVLLYIVASKGSIAPVVAGLSITYSLVLTTMVQWCVRSLDMTDNAMTSVERLLHFRSIPLEHDGADCTPINPAAWPSIGSIKFDRLCLKYRPELPLVLRGVDMEIQGGEKVGICGRTSAGKSSLMIALFRICEFERGAVYIDGLDISKLKLQELRRSLAIIPQDPVRLADTVTTWGSGLDFIVSERGDNLSVGQRQLFCIGRALLKDSKIVVLDEATANVDTATDNLIQVTIKETFQNKTVLIIAHRINTIMHCNKIAVMEAGRVAEFGSPSELLSQPVSIFASLAKRSQQQ